MTKDQAIDETIRLIEHYKAHGHGEEFSRDTYAFLDKICVYNGIEDFSFGEKKFVVDYLRGNLELDKPDGTLNEHDSIRNELSIFPLELISVGILKIMLRDYKMVFPRKENVSLEEIFYPRYGAVIILEPEELEDAED